MSTKEEIFNYVMHSPENTNPAVLGSMLNSAKELPDVSSEDEGKNLTVNGNGKWAAIMPKVTYIQATCELSSGGLFSIKQGEKYTTPAEIRDAIKSGEVIKFVASGMSYDFDNYTGLIFDVISYNDSASRGTKIKIIAVEHFKSNKTTIHHATINYSTNAIANVPMTVVEISDPA